MTMSKQYELSKRDINSTLRDIGIIGLTFIVAHQGEVVEFLNRLHIDPLFVSLVMYAVIELARKYTKDYTKE
jgi:hypothetical protein